MTPSEFKTWFRGFAEACGGAPTPEQWQRLKEVVKQTFGESSEFGEDGQLPPFPFSRPDRTLRFTEGEDVTVQFTDAEAQSQPLQGNEQSDPSWEGLWTDEE